MNHLIEVELKAILEASNDNIVITNNEGLILRASPSCISIYGSDTDSLIGKSVYELERQGIFSPSVTVKVLKEKKQAQVMQKTKTGRFVMATGIPVFDSNGAFIRVISFSHDLTEIQQLKDKFEELQLVMQRYETEIEEVRERETKTGGVIFESNEMNHVWDLVHRVSKSDASVLMLGESGVGKSMFAREIHKKSDRHQGPFIEVNCGAIPETLFESEMFGYAAGSFTGAHHKGKPGMIELAHNGTLFLDEVGEIPMNMQVKLLKVLEEKVLTRVGGTKPSPVNFRIIAATNKDLKEMMRKGSFREDLYFRLHVIPIGIPPLRDRLEDVKLLLQESLKRNNEKYGKNCMLDPNAYNALLHYSWPGNVRELENLMERLVLITDGLIEPKHLPYPVNEWENWSVEDETEQGMDHIPTLQEAIEEVEKKWLFRAYRHCKTTREMAKYLGISQPSVVRKLKQYQIDS
ncbi:sigma-54-dependent Fis family transcriptional regulator [Ammoniphilus sp. YIM 78166]|uniref:sigma-54 interaction domain-containing protein n=1 Tax=Ammoniphilus sp. YIM 78166 TaxID=1644106 RepID=UPI00106F5D87|nr:sigma 54-interacting transcriptional regulator [Ammoniphilus sp. YIM 78166]